ncbi:unnamed protein product [Trichobilharzia szidati]|nr:unnamed protein product [Trichobilharzia szidati]
MSLVTIDRSLIASENDCEEITDGDKIESSSRSSQSEDFLMCKGTAVGLNIHSRRRSSCIKANDEIQDHLKRIIALLRFGDYIQLIVKLQSANPKPHQHRYCCIISTFGKQETEESSILGVDITDGRATVGLVLSIWQDMSINLCGDGGFELITKDTVKQFKPVSVQALWAAFQAVNKACQVARANAYFCRGFTHDWVNYYHSLPASSTQQIQEWLKTDDIDGFIQSLSHSSLSDGATDEEKECARMEALIRVKLQEIMYSVDLEEVTVLQLRERLEEELKQPLRAYRHFIEKQILTIYGQMDEASVIFDHVLLGTTFNASNRDELERRNVTHILNVTREIDNFFPGDKFEYKNIRVYDDEQSSLLPYWEETHRFINEAKVLGTRCLVHCKMGISRSASTVIAYAMKEHNWDLETALSFVKCRRPCVQPNPGFMRELYTYQGILEASSNRHKPIFHNDQNKPNKMSPPGNTSTNSTNISQQNSNVTSSLSNNPGDNHQNHRNDDEVTGGNSPTHEEFEQNGSTASTAADGNLSVDSSSSATGNDSSSNSTVKNEVTRNGAVDLEKELFAFKRLSIPSITITNTTTTTTTAGSTNIPPCNSLNMTPNGEQEQQNHMSMTLSACCDTTTSSSTSMNRPVILWDFDDSEKGISGISNSTIVAKNSHCLRHWHPDVFENIDCFDRQRLFFNFNSNYYNSHKNTSLSVSPSSSSPSSITPTSPSQLQINQLNYANLLSATPIAWDYANELRITPPLEQNAKSSIIPCKPMNIPLVTCLPVSQATILSEEEETIDESVVEQELDKSNYNRNIDNVEESSKNAVPRRLSHVLRMVSKLSDSNLFSASLNQNAKEKISAPCESSYIPPIKWERSKSVNSSNTCTANTSGSSNNNNGMNTSSTSPVHLPRVVVTNSDVSTAPPNANLDSSVNTEVPVGEDLCKRNPSISNVKMRHIERRKSSYADLLVTTDSRTTTNNVVILPERSHSTRSSYRTSSRLRPDDSWIMNCNDCGNDTVFSDSGNPTSTITTEAIATSTVVITSSVTPCPVLSPSSSSSTASSSSSSLSSSPLSCSKMNTLHNSSLSLPLHTSKKESVSSTGGIFNPLNCCNTTESQFKVYACENQPWLQTRSKSQDRIICKSACEKLESNCCTARRPPVFMNKPPTVTKKTTIPTVTPASINSDGGSIFSGSPSNPVLLMLNSVNTSNSTYYDNKKSDYLPVNSFRPLRRVINWPPRSVDPLTATESYCS